MALEVSVTGGLGRPAVLLNYDANDTAYAKAKSLAKVIDNTYGLSKAIYYNPAHPPITPSSGYLVVLSKVASVKAIHAVGFGAITVQNNAGPATVYGGGAASGTKGSGQTVLAGDGGLTYYATKGDNTVVAGGGKNFIDLQGDPGHFAVYTSTGNDTIYGGEGGGTISAGGGKNQVHVSRGETFVQSTGSDSVYIAARGKDTISVSGNGSDVVYGPEVGPGSLVTFIGGNKASTVLSNTQASYTISGGAGGGLFYGGKVGHNLIEGGKGAITAHGAGGGDTLLGGSGHDLLIASKGNETLGGVGGANTFNLRIHELPGGGGKTSKDDITGFAKHDLIAVGSNLNINLALNTYVLTKAGGTFLLNDGTKVVLDGYTAKITKADFTV